MNKKTQANQQSDQLFKAIQDYGKFSGASFSILK